MKRKLLTLLGTVLLIAGISILVKEYSDKNKSNNAMESAKLSFIQDLEEVDNMEAVDLEGDIYGMLTIDKIDLELPVSASGDFGLLWHVLVAYDHSPLPPDKGNFVIAGHNGQQSCGDICGFRSLHRLNDGDQIKFQDRKNTYIYEVYKQFEVEADEVWILDPIEDETTLTLFTCHYRQLPKVTRWVLRAKLVDTVAH